MVRDLARPDSRVELSRLVDQYASHESEPARALFEASLNAALTLPEIRSLITGLGLSPNGVMMTSDRHWTWVWRQLA